MQIEMYDLLYIFIFLSTINGEQRFSLVTFKAEPV